jgi:hypothetical protein
MNPNNKNIEETMDMPNGAVPEVKGKIPPMNPNNKNNEETMDMPNGAVPEVKGETSPMILASMPLKKENVNAWYLLVSLVAAVVFMYFVFAIALPPHRIPSVNTAKSGSKDLKLERHGGDSVHTYDPQPSRAQKQCNTMPIQDNKFQKMYEEAKAAAEKAKAEAEEAKAEAEEAKAEAEEAKEEAKEIITALSVKLDVRTGSLHNQLEDAKKELNHEKAKNDQKWEAFTAAPITMAVDSYLVYWGIDEYVYDTTKAINKFLTFYDAEIIECMNLSATNPYKPHIETAVDYKFTIFSTIATSVWIFISRWQARGAVDTPVIIGTVVS